MTKKSSTLKGLGCRYGIKLRKQYTQAYRLLKTKRFCPECGSTKIIREAVGIWKCKKCKFKIAGNAYDVKF